MTHEDWELIAWLLFASTAIAFAWEALTARDNKTKDKED